jgi:urease subunit gamma/beta
LTAIELDRLTVFLAAELARRRRQRGLRLTYPEAVALITDEMHEAARSGASYEEVSEVAGRVLTDDDVMDGVASLVTSIRVECMFDDGMRLVIPSAPIQSTNGGVSSSLVPGSRLLAEDQIELNDGLARRTLDVLNTSADVIWVGSHFPFFEVNRRLSFTRSVAWGRHLDIAAGDAIRFAPHETTRVTLVEFGGQRIIQGFNGLTDGEATSSRLRMALDRAKKAGFADPASDR